MIYLDHNATTAPDPDVIEAMLAVWSGNHANAASPHAAGRAAAYRVERAREQVSDLLGVSARRVVMTSGSTEALNTAIQAAADQVPGPILLPPTEHKAVLDPVEQLASRGRDVRWLPVDRAGRVELADVAVDGPSVLVLMAANNETGVLQDVSGPASVVKANGGVVICDVTQQAGKLPLDLEAWGVDYAAASAHKLYGPQGVGALVVPPGIDAAPLIRGGGHERGWRSGTLNVAGIVGFGVAAATAIKRDFDLPDVPDRRDRLESSLRERAAEVTVLGADVDRLPNTTSVRVHGVQADALIAGCSALAFASGSACTSAVATTSHVLRAMGIEDAQAEEVVRLSIGRYTTDEDVERAVDIMSQAAARIRSLG